MTIFICKYSHSHIFQKYLNTKTNKQTKSSPFPKELNLMLRIYNSVFFITTTHFLNHFTQSLLTMTRRRQVTSYVYFKMNFPNIKFQQKKLKVILIKKKKKVFFNCQTHSSLYLFKLLFFAEGWDGKGVGAGCLRKENKWATTVPERSHWEGRKVCPEWQQA